MSDAQKEYYVGSDGNLEYYSDTYSGASDKATLAEGLEQYIIQQQQTIQQSFLKIGAALVKFEEEELYLARGVPNMKAWLSGPEFVMSYAHATKLMRIVRDLLPVLGTNDVALPLTTLTELLPMLSNGSTPEQIREAAEEVEDMTTRDAKQHLRELRGLEDHAAPTIFRARVRRGDSYHLVWITRTGDDGDTYDLAPREPLRIKPKDFDRFVGRAFGDAFIEYE